MSNFTCINCSVKFANADIQREHYKTDWHRYNLKRRVAELPPVTAEDFQSRVLEMRNTEAMVNAEKQMSLYCNACRKQFSSQKAHDNHFNSKKHRENQHKFEQHNDGIDKDITTKSIIQTKTDSAVITHVHNKMKYILTTDHTNGALHNDDYEDVEEDEIIGADLQFEDLPENPLSVRDCIFCVHQAEDIMDNLKHMSTTHSFFIPDAEYCIDLDGLLHYLGEKVAIYHVCLWCNDRGKTFYSLDAVRKHMIDKGHCQMLHEGLALAEYTDYYDYSSSYPDHDQDMDIDEEIVPDLLDGDEYQLVLPSGAVIGHRSLVRYYKQYLNPNRCIVPKKSDRMLHHLLSTYRSLGWSNTQQHAAARKARDIHVMKRVQAKWQMKLGCKANKLQKHYRAQVLF
uniref:C2H2-type domain-containing protein n=1 Tax=Glossina brevipalpis TaxID=37001 RepID=A0A1A9X4N0_9MUSC